MFAVGLAIASIDYHQLVMLINFLIFTVIRSMAGQDVVSLIQHIILYEEKVKEKKFFIKKLLAYFICSINYYIHDL